MKKSFLLLIAFSLIISICSCSSCDESTPDNNGDNNNNQLPKETEVLMNFLATNASYYQTLETYDYQVIIALAELEKHDIDCLDNNFVKELTTHIKDKTTYENISEVYKDIKILKAFEEGMTPTIANYLDNLTFEEIESWNYSYAYISLEETLLNPSLKDEIKLYFNNHFTNLYLDVDTASIYICSSIANQEQQQLLFDIINNSLSIEGALSNGNANSCSTAMVILALLSESLNPKTYLQYDLIDILLSYEQANNFKWLKTDEQVDLRYATPQSILSLASYYISQSTNQVVNLLG